MNKLQDLHQHGVSVWLDYLSRSLIQTGKLKGLIDEGLRGETSNPTIFQKAVSEGNAYDAQILALARQGMEGEAICWELMIDDIQHACDIFKPLYEQTQGGDGYVSLELNPMLARDADASLKQARELYQRVDRPNVMYKVPGTQECIPVIERLLGEGFNINITLLFDDRAYDQVIEAYFKGLEKRVAEGKPIHRIASVASFFVSRVDTEADARMDKLVASRPELKDKVAALHGKVAVANARIAYELFVKRFSGPRWEALKGHGATVQRPLWASTGTKNKAYSDTLYVHDLIGPHCVNTMPEDTMRAFQDHGVVADTLTTTLLQEAHTVLKGLADVGVDLYDVTRFLVDDGVKKFEQSYKDLRDAVIKEREKLLQTA
ncbi:MAG TPA: transaldolase [Candidatus Xenobia bacterium]|jgi:transaldolase